MTNVDLCSQYKKIQDGSNINQEFVKLHQIKIPRYHTLSDFEVFQLDFTVCIKYSIKYY